VTVLGILPDVCIGAILVGLALGILDGDGTVGDYTLYSGLLVQLAAGMFVLVYSSMRIYEDKLRIDNFRKFEQFENRQPAKGGRELSGDVGIEFRNVSFSYPGTDKVILHGLTFSIGKKEKVCIIGLNGAGKSTVMKLLLRFYDASDGEILINHVNIKEYDLLSLRKCFSSFFQDIVSYAFTLGENITISDVYKADGDQEGLRDALRRSDATGLAEGLPKGLGQYITRHFDEDGAELSGGQYQKLALARTFYRDCPVLLLDEPSASLDPEAEHKVFQYLEGFCKDKTAVFTSHRLSNVHLADRIILLEDGRVAEQGTHTQLLGNRGRYAQLYKYQADKFK
jgi:ABC-type multidrug transport system fused ATPase/permease subunit